jgi:hypothetical protein
VQARARIWAETPSEAQISPQIKSPSICPFIFCSFFYCVCDLVFIFTVVLPKFPLMQFTGGSVSKGSELQIEVAEFLWKDVEVTIEVVVLPVLCPNVLI